MFTDLFRPYHVFLAATPSLYRLREVDVKAEHFERQVTNANKERDDMEQKYEVGRTDHEGEWFIFRNISIRQTETDYIFLVSSN